MDDDTGRHTAHHLRVRRRRLDDFQEPDVAQLRLAGEAERQGRGELQARAAVEALGIGDGQASAVERPLQRAGQVEMADVAGRAKFTETETQALDVVGVHTPIVSRNASRESGSADFSSGSCPKNR